MNGKTSRMYLAGTKPLKQATTETKPEQMPSLLLKDSVANA